MKRFVLIDGNAILHRAYHALPPLTTSKGKLVNAVFGFCSMLLKVIHDLKPTHLAVAFDRPEPTFRQRIFEDYQAQRPKMEEELSSQLELVKKVLKTMEVPIYEKAGFEADDVIGSLAFQAKSQKLKTKNEKLKKTIKNSKREKARETIVVTGDRDILQLVDENIKVYMPVKGLSQAKLYGEKEVEEKFGIKPGQMVEFKALVGDPSDNYPGVRGVGPKTAKELLLCFKTLEQIYKNLNKIKKKLKVPDKVLEAIAEDQKQAKLAKKLAKIVTDVPIKLEIEKCKLRNLDKPKVRKLFEELEFRSLIPRLSKNRLDKKPDTSSARSEKKVTKENEQLSLI